MADFFFTVFMQSVLDIAAPQILDDDSIFFILFFLRFFNWQTDQTINYIR